MNNINHKSDPIQFYRHTTLLYEDPGIHAVHRDGFHTIARGMVITVDLNPTKGSETGKTRPCIIVTNNIYNERVPVIQVIPITAWNEKKEQNYY